MVLVRVQKNSEGVYGLYIKANIPETDTPGYPRMGQTPLSIAHQVLSEGGYTDLESARKALQERIPDCSVTELRRT